MWQFFLSDLVAVMDASDGCSLGLLGSDPRAGAGSAGREVVVGRRLKDGRGWPAESS